MNCREGKQDAWDEWVDKNPFGYGRSCVDGANAIGMALDDGKSPEDANKAMRGLGLSGHQARSVASMVSDCHVRGAEFRLWWLKDWEGDTGGMPEPSELTPQA